MEALAVITMIKNKTVLILGAGASKPFNFPLGGELLQLIVDSLTYIPATKWHPPEHHGPGVMNFTPGYSEDIDDDDRSDNELFQMLLDSGYKKSEIEKFSQNLIRSQLNSVDAFLEYRTEFIEIGKRAIVYNLLRYEVEKNVIENADWYKYIWGKMTAPFEEFGNNKVSFITFNYDRSLEYFLTDSMSALYGKTKEECYTQLSKIPIVHLHGKLGNLPWESKSNVVNFGEIIDDAEELAKVASSIRIIHEDIDKDPVFNQAYKLLDDASRICLLGFGYNQRNIDRLNLKSVAASIQGTAFGLTQLERQEIKRVNPKFQLGPQSNCECLDFLRESFSLS